jgi:Zn finger protein HypA/HybF involved in hydrogenase expression
MSISENSCLTSVNVYGTVYDMDEMTNEWGEPYRTPPCEYCESEMEDHEGRLYCPSCQPCVTPEYIVVRASFEVTGRGR